MPSLRRSARLQAQRPAEASMKIHAAVIPNSICLNLKIFSILRIRGAIHPILLLKEMIRIIGAFPHNRYMDELLVLGAVVGGICVRGGAIAR